MWKRVQRILSKWSSKVCLGPLNTWQSVHFDTYEVDRVAVKLQLGSPIDSIPILN